MYAHTLACQRVLKDKRDTNWSMFLQVNSMVLIFMHMHKKKKYVNKAIFMGNSTGLVFNMYNNFEAS